MAWRTSTAGSERGAPLLPALGGSVHEVVKVEQVGLKRGRCSQCKKKFTSYACAACRAHKLLLLSLSWGVVFAFV